MQVYEEDKFRITVEDGLEKEFYKILTFESSLTNKNYIIYTDNQYTNDNINIYSSILINNDMNNIKLEKINDEADKEEVNKALLQAKMNIQNIIVNF